MRRLFVPPALLAAACSADTPPPDPAPLSEPAEEARAAAAAADAPPPGFRADAKDCLVQTLYHEARGEGREGMLAVGAVVLNRKASVAYPDTICGVVKQSNDLGRCQFSWFCDGRSDALPEGGAVRQAEAVAVELMAGTDDPTLGATSFHAARVRPAWADELEETVRIGSHVFYANE